MKKIIVILALLPLFACEKDSEESFIPEDVCGLNTTTWVLTEEYYDPGDGSGEFMATTNSKSITWTNTGTFSAEGNLCYMGASPDAEVDTSFGIIDTVAQTFTIDACNGSTLVLSYELNEDENELLLYYPCIEPCILKFIKTETI